MPRRDPSDPADADPPLIEAASRRLRDEIADKRLITRARLSRRHTPQTLCVFLGPYRNLTTLTAAVLGLHPACVVLNHGFWRVTHHRALAPFARPPDPGFDRFLRFAAAASQEGRRGTYGGAIEESHAHERSAMREARARADAALARRPTEVVVWKDSMRVTNHLRTLGLPARKVAQRNPRLRFLLPIRNPIDCALSNAATNHGRYLAAARYRSPDALVESIVQEIRVFADLANKLPGSFHHFVEDDEPRKAFATMAELLGIDAPEEWLDLAELAWDVRTTYEHPPELRDAYARAIDYHLTDHPELHERLRRFAG